ncbi:MAG: oligosaccharide flippase family protein [Candidatus Omnitrophica bacterium]|nr:oligosaccharide flippase family protein [Candidatus Omnitrophota bacterium]
MKNSMQNIFAGSLQMYSARIVTLSLGILQNFILAKFLGPAGFGEISLFSLILVYAGLTGLGFDTVAAREIPGYVVLDKKREIDHIQNLSFSVELVFRIVISIIVALIGLFFFKGTLKVGILLISLVLVAQKISAYWRVIANATKKFSILSKVNILEGLLMGGLTIILVKFTGVYTRLLAVLCAQIAVGFYLIKSMPLDLKITFKSERSRAILKMGLPFVILSIVYYVWQASDRTLIARFMNFEMLGLYSFAASCVSLLLLFSEDVNAVLQPFMYERISSRKSRKEILPMIRKSTVLYAYLTPVLIFFLWILYPVILKLIMPGYLESVWPFRILLFQFYLVNINTPVNYLIRSNEVNRQSWLLLTYIIAGAVSYLAILLFWRMGLGMTGAALGVVFANIIAVIINFSIAHRYYLDDLKISIRYYVLILTPVIYTVLCLLIMEIAITRGILNSWIFQFITIVGLVSPLVFFANRELGLIREFFVFIQNPKKWATNT